MLEEAGSSLASVNKCNIFLVEPKDFDAMNAVYSTFFKDPKPVSGQVMCGEQLAMT